MVKEGEDSTRITSSMAMEKLETTLLVKIQEIQGKMEQEQDVDGLQKLGTTLSGLLENLEKLRKAKKA